MSKTGKKYTAAQKQVEAKPYTLDEAVPLVKKIKFAKFDETVELHMRLGVDPKHADQMVRGTVVLPNGLGKSKKVLVIASGDKSQAAPGLPARADAATRTASSTRPWLSCAVCARAIWRARRRKRHPAPTARSRRSAAR